MGREPRVTTGNASPTPTRRRAPVWITDLGNSGPRGLLAWQALTSAVGIFIGTALMALYLVGPADLSDGIAAATLAGSAALCLVATPPAARIIRVLGPRRFAIVSCLSRGVLFLLLPLSTAPAWTIGVVLLSGLFEAAGFSIYQIIIADALGEEARTEALAVRRTLGNIGFTVGGLLVGLVVGLGSRDAYAAAFVVSGIALAAAALILFRMIEPSTVPPGPEGVEAATVATRGAEVPRARALRDGRFVGMIAVATVMASSMHLLTVGVPLWVVRETEAPHGVVGALLVVNTVLVVVLQVRLARSSETWEGARTAVVRAGLVFAASVALVALAGQMPATLAVALLVTAAVLAAVAEMLDSAGWWTVSYEYPPAAQRSDYLAAFDVVTPAINIAGPPLMIAVVALGPGGWAAYAVLFLVASAAAAALVDPRRPRAGDRTDSTP